MTAIAASQGYGRQHPLSPDTIPGPPLRAQLWRLAGRRGLDDDGTARRRTLTVDSVSA